MPDPTGIDPSMVAYMVSVALQAHQFLFNGDRFLSGDLVLAYRPDLRHGEIIAVALPEKLAPYPGATLTAYAEKVEHSIETIGDAVRRRTRVTYSRGLFFPAFRPPPFVRGAS